MKKICMLALAFVCGTATASYAQLITSTTSVSEKTIEKKGRGDVKVWYEGELNLGYGMGGSLKYDGESEDAHFARPFIETVHGARITRYAFVGLGAGFQYAYDEEWEIGLVPVFLNLKGYYPVTEHFAPYVSVDLGYGLGVLGTKNYGGEEGLDLKGGLYASYGIGLNYKRLNFGFGWQHQSMKFAYEGESGDSFGANSFFLKVGLKF